MLLRPGVTMPIATPSNSADSNSPPVTAEATASAPPNLVSPPLPELPPNCALFLDLDGTLAPIVRRPELARVSRETLDLLRVLKTQLNGALAIVSGRPIAQVDVMLGPLRLPAAGVHGAQRRDAEGRTYRTLAEPPVALRRVMTDLVARFPNVWIEQKPGALALHYRAVPDAGPASGRVLREAVAAYAGWTLLGGKCVWEIKPREVSKGKAVEAFLNETPFAGRVPVFCGDDETDEDGFLVARVHGGFGIKVDGVDGLGGSATVATAADHRVATSAAFVRWLRKGVKS
jgi:trehalose 6-phosphate phosphatase